MSAASAGADSTRRGVGEWVIEGAVLLADKRVLMRACARGDQPGCSTAVQDGKGAARSIAQALGLAERAESAMWAGAK